MRGGSTSGAARGPALALGGVLLLAAALRVASLGVTEVEWWDSTIYLTEARRIAEGVPWAPPYETHRAPLLPWIGALSYGAGLGATGVYLANVAFSVGTVALTFVAGALLFGRRAGLVSAFLLAVSWESLFFTQRVLTETPALFFWVLAVVAYVLAVIRGRAAWLLVLGPAIALAGLAHFRAAAVLVALAVHFAVLGRWSLLRRREALAAAALGLAGLAAYAAFSARRFGGPLAVLGSYQVRRLGSAGPERLAVLARYLEYLPSYLGSVLFAVLAAAVPAALVSAARSRRAGSPPRGGNRSGLLLAALVLVPLAVPSLFEKFHHRLGVFCLPGLFLFLGAAIARAEAWLRPRSAAVARAALAGTLAVAAAQQLATADAWLHAEGRSYLSVREAGLWLRGRTAPDATIVTTSWPQVNYYAERRTADVPGSAGELEDLVRARRAPFLVLSDYERTPAWVAPFLEANGARVPRVHVAGDVEGLRTRVYDLSGLAGERRAGGPDGGRAGGGGVAGRR